MTVLELERYDRLLDVAWQVMERVHYAHSAGRPVTLDGTPLVDDGPALAAIDRIRRISEGCAKLLRLDAPVRHDVLSMDVIDAEAAGGVDRGAGNDQDADGDTSSARPAPALCVTHLLLAGAGCRQVDGVMPGTP